MRGISTSLTGENLKNVDWKNPYGSITLPVRDEGYATNDLGVLAGVITQQYKENGHRVLTCWDVRGDRSIIISWRPDPTVDVDHYEIDRNEVRFLGDPTTPQLPTVRLALFDLERGDKTEVGTTGHEIDPDGVNHPSHYNQHPSGVECVDIAQHYNFNVGNAIKYLWRAGLKTTEGPAREAEVKDINKAIWYLNQELKRLSID